MEYNRVLLADDVISTYPCQHTTALLDHRAARHQHRRIVYVASTTSRLAAILSTTSLISLAILVFILVIVFLLLALIAGLDLAVLALLSHLLVSAQQRGARNRHLAQTKEARVVGVVAKLGAEVTHLNTWREEMRIDKSINQENAISWNVSVDDLYNKLTWQRAMVLIAYLHHECVHAVLNAADDELSVDQSVRRHFTQRAGPPLACTERGTVDGECAGGRVVHRHCAQAADVAIERRNVMNRENE